MGEATQSNLPAFNFKQAITQMVQRNGSDLLLKVGRPATIRVNGDLVALGSAGYKTLAVVRGEVDAYVHAGGMYQWDSAAPVAVARAAGLTACRLDGSPLVYNSPEPWLPDLVVCRPELAEPILAAVPTSA